MVVFTCGHCGESVQKPKVEKHYLTKCRNRNPNLSCMDCFKDFLGKEYEEHTKCITEEERYSGKGFVAKEKKGEKKQNVWVEMLQSVLDEHKGAPKNVLRILETIGKHNNTPRKKPKFINFVKNVCGHKTNPKDIDQAWDLIAVKISALSNATQNKNQNQKNDNNGDSIGDTDEKSQNSDVVDNEETTKDKSENIPTEVQSDEADIVDEKKLSKKQLKEEKKRKKYEAELQSAVAVAPPVQAEEEEVEGGKKGKKKKNRTDTTNNGDVDLPTGGKNKQKRKRQDTVNGAHETIENGTEPPENVVVPKEKVQKKKRVNDCEELDESICLHDQNVAKIGELAMDSDKFNWHAVILSVLEKKGNEVQFKRLQKKVLGEYAEMTGRDVDDRIADKFIKKLKSAPNVRVDKNRVVLVQ